jgi:hypothetical protein
LDLGMAWIFIQRFGNDPQPQRPDVTGSDEGDAGTLLRVAAYHSQQMFRRGDLQARDRNPGFIPVRTQLEIGAGDPGSGSLPARPPRDVAKEIFIVGDIIHDGPSA